MNGIFTLDSQQKGLSSAILNEVLYGFTVDNFQEEVGLPRPEIQELHNLVNSEIPGVAVTAEQRDVLAKSLKLTLVELGPDEFQIRTGYDYDEAKKFLHELTAL